MTSKRIQVAADSACDLPPETYVIEVCPSLGAHIGLGAIGAATLNQDWRV